MIKETEFLENLSKVKREIASSCLKYGRSLDEITLLPVTKNWPIDAVTFCRNSKIKSVGENRVQEALSKMDGNQSMNFELIGHLQSNKAKHVVGKFSSIQTIDSLKLMDRVNSVALLNDLIQPILLQVNAGNDPAKFGVSIEDTEALLEHALTLNGICVDGFMTIAPYDLQNKSVARSCFSNLRNLRDQMSERFDCRFSKLSMGMSGDMDEAIAEGSTMIRVGSALFGNRAPVV